MSELVEHIAEKYTHRGFPLDGLIEAGNAGLSEARSTYDPASTWSFNTYATWYVRRAIRRAYLPTPPTQGDE